MAPEVTGQFFKLWMGEGISPPRRMKGLGWAAVFTGMITDSPRRPPK
jgi:hypothetical protein